MTSKRSIRRYRRWYAQLLRFYPTPYYERFGEGMEQTFSDLLHERRDAQRGVFTVVLWLFVETFTGIFKERIAMHTKNIIRIALATMFILMLPLVAMQFTDGVGWGLADFIFAFVLIFGTGLAYQLVSMKAAGNIAYKVAVGLALGAGFLLVWTNAAVGIIGDGSVNMLYPGVILVGLIGAIAARLEPRGMSRALVAMAIAMMLVPVIALIIGTSDFAPGVVAVFGLNAFFALLFVGSAYLFQRASATDSMLRS